MCSHASVTGLCIMQMLLHITLFMINKHTRIGANIFRNFTGHSCKALWTCTVVIIIWFIASSSILTRVRLTVTNGITVNPNKTNHTSAIVTIFMPSAHVPPFWQGLGSLATWVNVKQQQQKANHDTNCKLREFDIGDAVHICNFKGTLLWLPGSVDKCWCPVSY